MFVLVSWVLFTESFPSHLHPSKFLSCSSFGSSLIVFVCSFGLSSICRMSGIGCNFTRILVIMRAPHHADRKIPGCRRERDAITTAVIISGVSKTAVKRAHYPGRQQGHRHDRPYAGRLGHSIFRRCPSGSPRRLSSPIFLLGRQRASRSHSGLPLVGHARHGGRHVSARSPLLRSALYRDMRAARSR